MHQLARTAILSLLVVAPSIAGAQTTGAHLPDWVAEPAARTVKAAPASPARGGWSSVLRLHGGETLVVTADGWHGPLGRLFVAADGHSLTLLNAGLPDIPSRARGVLRDLASQHADDLTDVFRGQRVLLSGFDFHLGGVWFDGVRIGDLDDVLVRVHRPEVVTIVRRSALRLPPLAEAVAASIASSLLQRKQPTLTPFAMPAVPVSWGGRLVGACAFGPQSCDTPIYQR